jgi:hypothetical protein
LRPDTVHALAQFIRHARAGLTTAEKFLAHTTPETLHEELGHVIFVARGALNELTTTLGSAPASAAPGPAPSTKESEIGPPASGRPTPTVTERVTQEIGHARTRGNTDVLQPGERRGVASPHRHQPMAGWGDARERHG